MIAEILSAVIFCVVCAGAIGVFILPVKLLLMWRNGDLPGGDTVGVLVGVVALFSPVLMGYLVSNADSIAQNITAVIIDVFR